MDFQYIDPDEQGFILTNALLVFLNLAVNIFYAWCLIRQRLKQPLKILLGCIIWCTILYCVSLTLLYCVLKDSKSFEMSVVSFMIVVYYTHNSMTCYAWLNFYYYVQIVPAQRTLLVWIKKNIRSVIYVTLLLDGMLFLFNATVNIAHAIFKISSGSKYINATWTEHYIYDLSFLCHAFFFISNTYLFVCLCIMTFSSISMAHYLHRQMRSLAQSGNSFSTSRIQSQIRVTTSGITQGVLYFLFDIFYFFDSFTYVFSSPFSLSIWVSFMVISFYISGTTVSLGIGQATFKQRAADVWKALKRTGQCCHGNKRCKNTPQPVDIR